jgi:anion-transporting  ArsA/GET3 family ATPase
MTDMLDKRLIFVAGKGGVGKSTVAAALGMLAARRGRRTIVAEVAHQDHVARSFDREIGAFEEVELAPGLFTISIDPRHALDEYLHIQLRVRPLADLLTSSRTFNYFAAAAPGLAEMVTLGKAWELAQPRRRTRGGEPYDLVIVDSPASGHGVATLRTPRFFAEVARVGPAANHARRIDAMVRDASVTGVVAVALPEEMPVNETAMLRDQLRAAVGLEFDRVIVNAVYPQRFDASEADELERAEREDGDGPAGRAAVRAALSEHRRAAVQRREIARLEQETGAQPLLLPFVFEPELHRPQLEELSRRLEAAW